MHLTVYIVNILHFLGLKCAEFPKDLPSQNTKAMEIIKELVTRVLGREEQFTLSVRRGTQNIRYAKDSPLLLLPPIEVSNLY